MSAPSGNDEQPSRSSARRSARLTGVDTPSYDMSSHPQDDDPGDGDYAVAKTSSKPKAKKPKTTPAPKAKQPKAAKPVAEDDDSSGGDDDQDDLDAEFSSESEGKGKRKKRDYAFAKHTGRIAPNKGKSIETTANSRIRRRREIRQRDGESLEEDAGTTQSMAHEELKPFFRSFVLPKTKQQLRDMRFSNCYRLTDVLSALVIPDEEPARWSKATYTISAVARLPVQSQRDYVCTKTDCKVPSKHHSIKRWFFTFQNRIDGETFTPKHLNNVREGAVADANAAQLVGDRICEYLNRWPVPLPKDPGDEKAGKADNAPYGTFWPLVGFTAFFDVFPGYDNSVATVLPQSLGKSEYPVFAVRVEHKHGHWIALTTAQIIQENWQRISSAGGKRFRFSVPARMVRADVDVPDCPPWWPFSGPSYEKVGDEHLQSVKKVVKLVKWLSYKMSPFVGSLHAHKRRQQSLMAPFMRTDVKNAKTTKGKRGTGAYKGGRLLYWRCHPRSTSVEFRSQSGKDSKATVHITVKAHSKLCVAHVMDVIHTSFFAGHGIKVACKHGAFMADLINTGKITKDDILQNTRKCAEHKHATPHPCHGCLTVVDCMEMIIEPDGHRYCERCAVCDRSDGFEYRDYLLKRLRADFYQDKRRLKLPEERYESLLGEMKMRAQALQDSATGAYMDIYAGSKLRQFVNVVDPASVSVTKGFMRIQDPFEPCVDAPYPLWVDETDNVSYYHHPKNMVVTSKWLNLAKHRWLPAILELIKEYRQRVVKQALSSDSEEVKDILRRIDHVYTIACTIPRGHPKRKTIKPRFQKSLHQWRTAIADPTESPKYIWCFTGRSVDTQWQPPRLADTERVIGQMEDFYGHKVPRCGPQQVPWLWLPEHQLKQWNWQSLYAMFGNRLDRLDDICDEEEDHLEESSDTLILECIRQFLECDGKDVFLGLPMTIFANHPLCFAVAHKVHGLKMRTGWKTPEPKDLHSDYDQSLSTILFEPQVANFAKHNFHDDTYDKMLEDLSSVNVPNEYYEHDFSVPVRPIAQLSLLNTHWWSRQKKSEVDDLEKADFSDESDSDDDLEVGETNEADDDDISGSDADDDDDGDVEADDGDVFTGIAEAGPSNWKASASDVD